MWIRGATGCEPPRHTHCLALDMEKNMPIRFDVASFAGLLVLAAAGCRQEPTPLQGADPGVPSPQPVQSGAPPSGNSTNEPAASGSSPRPEGSDPKASETNTTTPAIGTSPTTRGAPAPGSAPTAGGGATGSNAAVQPGHVPPSAADSAALAAELSAPLSDEQIALIAEGLSSGEIEQAKLAQTKATDTQVKSFAQKMIEHHGRSNRQLGALKTKKAESSLASTLARDSKLTMDMLTQANGADFDRAYVQAQVDGHQKALDTLQKRLLPEAGNAALKSHLQKLKPMIEQHLAQARAIQSALTHAATAANTAARSPGR